MTNEEKIRAEFEEWYGNAILPCAKVKDLNDILYTKESLEWVWQAALAKHKAGESAGFTEEDLILTIAKIIYQSRPSTYQVWEYTSTMPDAKKERVTKAFTWEESREDEMLNTYCDTLIKEAQAIISALKQCGALRVKGE